MSGFLIGAILLLVGALACVLLPLLRTDSDSKQQVSRNELNLAVLRDQLRELDTDLAAGTITRDAYQSARHDLERRVADELRLPQAAPAVDRANRWTAPVIGLSMPIAATLLYLLLGSPIALDRTQVGAVANTPHEANSQEIEGMVENLAQRLQHEPGNAEGWHMLARSYNALERHREASEAYAHLAQLLPNDADVLADYADTLAMVRGRSLQGQPEKLVEGALALDSNHIKAMALSGTAAFERGDYAQAVERWQRIMRVAPADSDIARSTFTSIGEAKKMMAQGADLQIAAAGEETQANAHAHRGQLEGMVELDPALNGKVAQTDTVFVFARAAEGPRIPLAVLRKQVKDLPLKFVLDDSMSMTPSAKLSDFPLVVVGVRISASGSASPRAGDFETHSAPVRVGTSGLALRIMASRPTN